MGSRTENPYEVLEGILAGVKKPSDLPLLFLAEITDHFSEERKLGVGAFGMVYKGLLRNGEMVVVKKISQEIPTSQTQFENEVNLLMKLKHQNIVRLVGYCYETRHLHMRYEGKSVFAGDTESLLCLEYMPNGSLDKYISDASSTLNWHTRSKIIEGISYGLQYLHEHPDEPIIHLDLKPANILLDAKMLPKIKDFGLSRLFAQNKTIKTETHIGTLGYMPPEYLRGTITPMWDIFSLGVIIMEVITGHRDYPYDLQKGAEGFIVLELKKWRNRLQEEPGYTSLETDCQQIEKCIQIGLICVNPERSKRPTMKKIIDMLEGFESMNLYNEMTAVIPHEKVGTKNTIANRLKTTIVELENTPSIQLQIDHPVITARSELERMLFDETAEPKPLPFLLLEHITGGFSDDKQIGRGGFATVYKGRLVNGTIAVKKFFRMVDYDDKKFLEEIHCLIKAKHKNIVRFLGYCSDTQGEILEYEGKPVLADLRERLLCFEYLPKGSLEKKITDATCGLQWRKRYQIINGICDGLYHLHQMHIVHLDLKPENILLNDNMMPKIADFGISRCFDEKQSRATISKVIGTMGYVAPEFFRGGHITFKSDIYSLGIIIIEILTGKKSDPDIENVADSNAKQKVAAKESNIVFAGIKVLESWRNRLEKSEVDTQLLQIQVCTEIAKECTELNPMKRPDIHDIIKRLGATKSVGDSVTEIGTC